MEGQSFDANVTWKDSPSMRNVMRIQNDGDIGKHDEKAKRMIQMIIMMITVRMLIGMRVPMISMNA